MFFVKLKKAPKSIYFQRHAWSTVENRKQFFNLTGSTNNQSDPATSGITYEAFFIPVQNIRIGAQYTSYAKYQGASNNYDGAGRNASDNNSMFLYVWFAY